MLYIAQKLMRQRAADSCLNKINSSLQYVPFAECNPGTAEPFSA